MWPIERIVLSSLLILPAIPAVADKNTRRGITIPLIGRDAEDDVIDARGLTRSRSFKYSCQDTFGSFEDLSHSYNTTTPCDLINDNAKRAPTSRVSLQLAEVEGLQWFGKVTIGVNPLTTFLAHFDSGSSDIIVVGPDCVDLKCEGHRRYNPKSERSFPLNVPFHIRYGFSADAELIAGQQYEDTVYVSGLVAEDQVVGVAKTWSGGPHGLYAVPDVVFGLGFRAQSQLNIDKPTFLETLLQDGEIDRLMFSYKVDDIGSTAPELALGFANKALYEGDIFWSPVVGGRDAQRWIVALQGIGVNDQVLSLGSMNAVVDTGTTYIHALPHIVAEFYASIDGAKDVSSTIGSGFWSVPCQNIPWVSLLIGKTRSFIRPDKFIFRGRGADGRIICIGGLVPMSIPQDSEDIHMIVGNLFLRNVYTVFDYGDVSTAPRIGFAKLRNAGTVPVAA